MPNRSKEGVILFIVIGVIVVVSILAAVILKVISNQSSLTHHQVTRIQAQYVAKAGMVYALERLRTKTWTCSPVNSCPNPNGCLVADSDFPPQIDSQQVRIIFCPAGSTCQYVAHPCSPPAGSSFCINSTATYSQ